MHKGIKINFYNYFNKEICSKEMIISKKSQQIIAHYGMPTSQTTIFVYCTTFGNLVYFTIDLLLIRKATLAQP